LGRRDGDVGVVEGDAAVAVDVAHLDHNLRLLHLAEGQAAALPLAEMLGDGDVATASGALPNAEDLQEVGVLPRNGRLVDSPVGANLVLASVRSERRVAPGRCLGGAEGSWRPAEG